MTVTLGKGDALLITDVQRDFLPGGSLGVADGDAVVPVLNRYIEAAKDKGLPIFASRDWHPANHCSFKPQGGPWPEHCVAETPGAAFAEGLRLPKNTHIIDKAMRPEADAYSAFKGTTLAEQLRSAGASRLLVGGLTTDYCVLNTVLDALKEGFKVLLLKDAIRAVNAKPGDRERAERDMIDAGAIPLRYEDLAR